MFPLLMACDSLSRMSQKFLSVCVWHYLWIARKSQRRQAECTHNCSFPPHLITAHQHHTLTPNQPTILLVMRVSLLVPCMLCMLSLPNSAQAGPVCYTVCQAGCTGVAFTCYSAAGFAYGRAAAASVHFAANACAAAFMACQAACTEILHG